jgi:hypothetical protein
MLERTAPKMRKGQEAWAAAGLLLCVAYAVGGCATQSRPREAQNIPRYANSNMYCRDYNYSPQLIPLLPECKPDPPGSTVYQQATTVWTYYRSNSKSPSAGPNRKQSQHFGRKTSTQ